MFCCAFARGIAPVCAFCLIRFFALAKAHTWGRTIAAPLPCRKPCKAEQIPVRVRTVFAPIDMILSGADSFRCNRKKKRNRHYVTPISLYITCIRRKSKVENLRFSPFYLSFFFLSPFGRSTVCLYAYVRPNDDFPSKLI